MLIVTISGGRASGKSTLMRSVSALLSKMVPGLRIHTREEGDHRAYHSAVISSRAPVPHIYFQTVQTNEPEAKNLYQAHGEAKRLADRVTNTRTVNVVEPWPYELTDEQKAALDAFAANAKTREEWLRGNWAERSGKSKRYGGTLQDNLNQSANARKLTTEERYGISQEEYDRRMRDGTGAIRIARFWKQFSLAGLPIWIELPYPLPADLPAHPSTCDILPIWTGSVPYGEGYGYSSDGLPPLAAKWVDYSDGHGVRINTPRVGRAHIPESPSYAELHPMERKEGDRFYSDDNPPLLNTDYAIIEARALLWVTEEWPDDKRDELEIWADQKLSPGVAAQLFNSVQGRSLFESEYAAKTPINERTYMGQPLNGNSAMERYGKRDPVMRSEEDKFLDGANEIGDLHDEVYAEREVEAGRAKRLWRTYQFYCDSEGGCLNAIKEYSADGQGSALHQQWATVKKDADIGGFFVMYEIQDLTKPGMLFRALVRDFTRANNPPPHILNHTWKSDIPSGAYRPPVPDVPGAGYSHIAKFSDGSEKVLPSTRIISPEEAEAGRQRQRDEYKYLNAKAVSLSYDELITAIEFCNNRFEDSRKTDDDNEGHSGSPGEYLYERLSELETERDRRDHSQSAEHVEVQLGFKDSIEEVEKQAKATYEKLIGMGVHESIARKVLPRPNWWRDTEAAASNGYGEGHLGAAHGMARAIQMFRNEASLGRANKLRESLGFQLIVEAWDRYVELNPEVRMDGAEMNKIRKGAKRH